MPAPAELMPQVYDELRRLAANYLRRERPGRTLQATALVHEAYLRLSNEQHQPWKNRTHFLAIAALSMRQILVQRARANTRFHLAFTASTYPEQLSAQRKTIATMVFAADVGFSLMMMATGLVIAGDPTGWGALMAAFGLGAGIGFVLIEPTTGRAAFGDEA